MKIFFWWSLLFLEGTNNLLTDLPGPGSFTLLEAGFSQVLEKEIFILRKYLRQPESRRNLLNEIHCRVKKKKIGLNQVRSFQEEAVKIDQPAKPPEPKTKSPP